MTAREARLVFDSEQTGGLMGARSLIGTDRSLLFSAGSIVVDLVVYRGSQDMRIVHGQVVTRDDEAPITGATVRLGVTGEASETDEFGQFHLSTMLPFEQTILSIEAEEGELRCAIPARCESNGVAR